MFTLQLKDADCGAKTFGQVAISSTDTKLLSMRDKELWRMELGASFGRLRGSS